MIPSLASVLRSAPGLVGRGHRLEHFFAQAVLPLVRHGEVGLESADQFLQRMGFSCRAAGEDKAGFDAAVVVGGEKRDGE